MPRRHACLAGHRAWSLQLWARWQRPVEELHGQRPRLVGCVAPCWGKGRAAGAQKSGSAGGVAAAPAAPLPSVCSLRLVHPADLAAMPVPWALGPCSLPARWHWEASEKVNGGNLLGLPGQPRLLMLAPGVALHTETEEGFRAAVVKVGVQLCLRGIKICPWLDCPRLEELVSIHDSLGGKAAPRGSARAAAPSAGDCSQQAAALPAGATLAPVRPRACNGWQAWSSTLLHPQLLGALVVTPATPGPPVPLQFARLAEALGRRFVPPNPPCDSVWLGVFTNEHAEQDGYQPGDPADAELHTWPDRYDGMSVRAAPPAASVRRSCRRFCCHWCQPPPHSVCMPPPAFSFCCSLPRRASPTAQLPAPSVPVAALAASHSRIALLRPPARFVLPALQPPPANPNPTSTPPPGRRSSSSPTWPAAGTAMRAPRTATGSEG